MYTDVILPNLGFGMEEGKLIAWHKKPGDSVKKGDPLAEIESDKASVELTATVDGVLVEILAQGNQVVPVGGVLARINTSQGNTQTPTPISSQRDSATQIVARVDSHIDSPRATPLAKRIADAQGIDLAAVKGSGYGGTIRREDIEAAVIQQPLTGNHRHSGRVLAAPAVRKSAADQQIDLTAVPATGSYGQITRADLNSAIEALQQKSDAKATRAVTEIADTGARQEVVLSSMRQTIARRLVQSVQESPHFFTTAEFDLTNALKTLPKAIGINNLLLFLTVQALKDVPEFNATYEDGHLYHYTNVHLAIAVALPKGLIAPVLHHADEYSLSGLATRARDLISRARENRLSAAELSGGTFTVSNLGMIKQVDHFTAIINPPQVAILAAGSAKPRPVVIGDGLSIRTTMYLTLSADHRFVDGLLAGRFLAALDTRLQSFSN